MKTEVTTNTGTSFANGLFGAMGAGCFILMALISLGFILLMCCSFMIAIPSN